MIDFRLRHRIVKAFLPALFILPSLEGVEAQADPLLSFEIEGLAEGDTIYLANYYGNKMYYADTTIAGKKGRFDFVSPGAEKGGKYGLVLPENAFVEFIVTGEAVSLEAIVTDLPGSVKVTEGEDTQLFYDYLGFIQAG